MKYVLEFIIGVLLAAVVITAIVTSMVSTPFVYQGF
jgi:hypothetical protein